MRQRLIYLLKHNSFLQRTYRTVFSWIFRLVGLFVRTDEQLVLFMSMMGTRYNDSPKVIYEYIKSHSQYANMRCVWVFEHPENYPDLATVKIDTLKFFIMALKAKYWITNTQFERGLSFKKPQTIYTYTCHGTGIKLCGNSCPGRKDFDYSRVDNLCVSSEFDKYVMTESFKAQSRCFVECGRPCNDELWHVSETYISDIKNKLKIPDGKKVILYAPTWRDSVDAGRTYAIAPPIDFSTWEKQLGDEYVVLFRAHHITTMVMNIQFNDFVRDMSDYSEINDLMIAADILISDYSSVLVDYAILEKPILCFAYDYDEYLKERGTYFDLDTELPNKSCRSERELLDRIIHMDYEKECNATRRFKEKYDQFGGNAVETIVKKIFGCLN